MSYGNNQLVFFELLRAGLWGKEVRLSQYKDIDYSAVTRLAEEQSVVGVIAAGLEKVVDVKAPKEEVLKIVGQTLQLEQRNRAMNAFVAKLITTLQEEGVHAILVKGQGIARCYENPLWRACGDVDLLLNADDYEKAKVFLSSIASEVEKEDVRRKHIGLIIDSWVVELHGSMMPLILSKKTDIIIEELADQSFSPDSVRYWDNEGTSVPLPPLEVDVLIIFTHILQHFFRGGIGLRQICDWCRVLWTYKDLLNQGVLESRIKRAGLMSEWKVFGVFAVEYLGMPIEAMQSYDEEGIWRDKATKVMSFVMETGNFGHNRDMSYVGRKPYIHQKIISFSTMMKYSTKRFLVFPKDSIIAFSRYASQNLKALFNGK